MKIVIFDSSTIITLAMNGLTDILQELKKGFNGKFLMTREVKNETIDHPMNIKKFELGALQVSELLNQKVLELPESAGIESAAVSEKTQEILKQANNIFYAGDGFMHIIDAGEASCLAVSMLASKKGIENIIAIDERTTRMLSEKPENLYKLFERKLHTKIKFFKENIPEVSRMKFIRSSEIVYIAWKKKLVHFKDEEKRILDALLYATKFRGASISREEIEEIKSIG